jgi:hypothetical protein
MRDRETVAGQHYLVGAEAIRAGGHNLSLLPGHLVMAIKGTEDFPGTLWRDRKVPPEGRRIQLDSFHAYLTLPMREGLHIPSMYFLRQLLTSQGQKGEAALKLVRDELMAVDGIDFDEQADQEKAKLLSEGRLARDGEIGRGRINRSDNITPIGERGTSASYLAARLARDHPDLSKRTTLPKLHKDHLSIHAAAVEAGITRKPTALENALKAFRKLSAEERRAFLEAIRSF